jgi:hypothetical protein
MKKTVLKQRLLIHYENNLISICFSACLSSVTIANNIRGQKNWTQR